nr:hypothetical protein [Tanacetum cinerariifolium]
MAGDDTIITNTTSISPLPKSPFLALQNPHWNNAMHDEYNALVKLARLVTNGSSQQLGIDCDETFSPVVKPATIRTVLSLVVSRMWPIHQLDVKNAFLNEDLSETVYMHQPPGFVDPWYPHHGSQVAYLLIYVDDSILTPSFTYLLQQVITSLHNEFDMTNLGALNNFLDISATHHYTELFLSQKQYAIELLVHAHMTNYIPLRTPVDTEAKLGPEGVPVQDPTLYRSLAGGLQYLTFTRPDISYAVQQIFLYIHDPATDNGECNSRRRLRSHEVSNTTLATPRNFGFWISLVLFYYHLSCWGTQTRIGQAASQQGGLLQVTVFFGDNLLPRSSKCQQTIARSSAEAEYRGVANVVAETAWLRNLLRELHSPLSATTLVYCDDVSATYLSTNPVQHQRTKHIEIDIHFVHDLVTAGQV